MTFDLFGRGYSDAPVGVDYDEQLFATQILYVLYSSPLSWDRFSLVGYSLGGGIAVSFAAHFAERIEALVLFAPGGILNGSKLGLLLKLGRGGWVPAALETYMVGRQVGVRTRAHAEDLASEDGLDYGKIMRWQASSHKGFAMAFGNSFRHGPLYDRQQEWREVAKKGIQRVGILVGGVDDVIPPTLLPEMVDLLGGKERVRGEVLADAGHTLVRDRWRECMDFVVDVVGYPEEEDDVYEEEEDLVASRSSYVVGDF
jgi:pimeloyl-ACP methyl ester carboxylesterase